MNKNLHILLIGGIGVQTFTSCSSDDGSGKEVLKVAVR